MLLFMNGILVVLYEIISFDILHNLHCVTSHMCRSCLADFRFVALKGLNSPFLFLFKRPVLAMYVIIVSIAINLFLLFMTSVDVLSV